MHKYVGCVPNMQSGRRGVKGVSASYSSILSPLFLMTATINVRYSLR